MRGSAITGVLSWQALGHRVRRAAAELVSEAGGSSALVADEGGLALPGAGNRLLELAARPETGARYAGRAAPTPRPAASASPTSHAALPAGEGGAP